MTGLVAETLLILFFICNAVKTNQLIIGTYVQMKTTLVMDIGIKCPLVYVDLPCFTTFMSMIPNQNLLVMYNFNIHQTGAGIETGSGQPGHILSV